MSKRSIRKTRHVESSRGWLLDPSAHAEAVMQDRRERRLARSLFVQRDEACVPEYAE